MTARGCEIPQTNTVQVTTRVRVPLYHQKETSLTDLNSLIKHLTLEYFYGAVTARGREIPQTNTVQVTTRVRVPHVLYEGN